MSIPYGKPAAGAVGTDDQKVVGIHSAFDLLELVEDHCFQLKQKPTPSCREAGGPS